MMGKPAWKELQSHRDWATKQGESITEIAGRPGYPVDPVEIVTTEPAIYLK